MSGRMPTYLELFLFVVENSKYAKKEPSFPDDEDEE